MGHLFLNIFLKESVIVFLYGIYAIALLISSALYYNQLHSEGTAGDDAEAKSKIFDQAVTLSAEEAEKILNFTRKIFRLYFPEDEDAWRVCSILGIGFGVFNIVITLFTFVVMGVVFTELKSQRRKAEKRKNDNDHDRQRQKPPNNGTQKCTKSLFLVSLTVTLIFTTFSALTLLSTGGLGGKTRVYAPHLTAKVFGYARAFFGTVALPAFIFIVFLLLWLVYTCCSGISCGWSSSGGAEVVGKSGIFEYIQNGKTDKQNFCKVEEDQGGKESYAMDSLHVHRTQAGTIVDESEDDRKIYKSLEIGKS